MLNFNQSHFDPMAGLCIPLAVLLNSHSPISSSIYGFLHDFRKFLHPHLVLLARLIKLSKQLSLKPLCVVFKALDVLGGFLHFQLYGFELPLQEIELPQESGITSFGCSSHRGIELLGKPSLRQGSVGVTQSSYP